MNRKKKIMMAVLVCAMTFALAAGSIEIIGMMGSSAVTVQAIGSGGESSEDAQRLAEFNSYKSEKKTVAGGMSREGDSADSAALIARAMSDIDALQYDSGKTLADNKAVVDLIVSDLENALAAQRAADAKEAEDTAAANEVTKRITALPAVDKITSNDRAVIEAARAAYDALTKDQKSKVTQTTLKTLTDAEVALHAYERAEFNSYKSEKKTVAKGMSMEGDSAVSTALIANATSAIDTLQYDSSKTLEDNKAAVDLIVSELETSLAAQRAGDSADNDTAAANAVTESIIALPATDRITPNDRAVIEAARAAYDSLTKDQKSKVSSVTLQVLIDAEEALYSAEAKAEEARRAEEAAAKKAAEEKAAEEKAAAEQAEWNGVLTTSIPAAKSVKAKAAKKKVTITWKKLDKKKLKKFSKIEIQVCPDTGFAKANTIRKEVGKNKKSVKIGGLASKGVYYVRVRNVQGSGAGKTVSKWSNPKKIKIK